MQDVVQEAAIEDVAFWLEPVEELVVGGLCGQACHGGFGRGSGGDLAVYGRVDDQEAADLGRPEPAAPRLDLGIAAGAGRVLWDEPCYSWIAIPDDLPRGRFVALTVKGDSMLPLLHSEDVVLVKLGSDVARDSIVVARRPDDGYVVKRVGRVSGAAIELLSLNPDFAPTLIERAEGTVAGTVVLRWCRHGG